MEGHEQDVIRKAAAMLRRAADMLGSLIGEVAEGSKPERKPRKRAAEALSWSPEGGWAGISEIDMKAWADAYPEVQVRAQLAMMNQWLISNPERRKKQLWRKFITGWLSRSAERARSGRGGTVPPVYGVAVRHHSQSEVVVPVVRSEPKETRA